MDLNRSVLRVCLLTLSAPSTFIGPEFINAPSIVLAWITFLYGRQHFLKTIVIAMEPVNELSVFTLGGLSDRLHDGCLRIREIYKVDGYLNIAWDRPSRLCIHTAFFIEIVGQIKLEDLIRKNDRLKKGLRKNT